MNSEPSREESRKTVLGGKRTCRRRATEVKNVPDIAADPAFWLKGVFETGKERG